MSPSLCIQDLADLFDQPVQRHSCPLDIGTLEWSFEQVCTDSRSLQAGDLFIPLRGERFDGHNFLGAAVAVGAAGALVARDWRGHIPEQLTYLIVEDTLDAYQQVALLWRRQLKAPVVAVTGSAGKTSTRELIKACLQPLGSVEASSGNENNDIGVPRTLLRARQPLAALVLEMGMRGLGEIERLSRCSEPSVAVITNVGTAHIGRLGSREAIATAKCEICAALHPAGLVVIPAGDPLLEAALARVWRGRVVRVALAGSDFATADSPAAQLVAELQNDSAVVGSELFGSGLLFSDGSRINLPLEGRHNAMNLLLALAVAEELGVPRSALTCLQVALPGGRARRIALDRGPLAGVTLLDESYNASPEAMFAALELLHSQGGRRFAVLGSMLELGDQSEVLHRQVGARAGTLGLDGLVVVGEGPDLDGLWAAAAAVPLRRQVAQPEAAASLLFEWLEPGDHLLLKASRGVALERLIPLLSGPGAGSDATKARY
ncbi:MAG: UDP-N-acetylmuramoyl-tripeptide--D-alanyl-D-alanine ligase [Cyanobacteriota bacterium]|jgi:UDP-N-acetylmuramoyl-tripeptide--D-alanyl-D-alanine ligase